MDRFWSWFFGEAGAGWIVGLIGIALGLIAWLKRERPPKVVIQEVKKTRLLDLDPSQHERLVVSYSDQDGTQRRIRALEQRDIAIYNAGTADLKEPVELTFEYTYDCVDEESHEDEQDFPSVWLFKGEDRTSADVPSVIGLKDSDTGIITGDQVRIPYLNSYSEHKHYVAARVVSAGGLEIELAGNSGKGWSSHFVRLTDIASTRKRTQRVLMVTSSVLAFVVLVLIAVPALFDFGMQLLGPDVPVWRANLSIASIEDRVESYIKACKEEAQYALSECEPNGERYAEALGELAEMGDAERLAEWGRRLFLLENLGYVGAMLGFFLGMMIAVLGFLLSRRLAFRLNGARDPSEFSWD